MAMPEDARRIIDDEVKAKVEEFRKKIAPVVKRLEQTRLRPPSIPDLPIAPRNPPAATVVPPEHRSKPATLRKIAKALGKPDNKKSATWVGDCIRDGTIPGERINRQSYVVDLRHIPEKNHYLLK